MKIYLAVSMTFSHNYHLYKSILDFLESQGHQLLDKHVCYPNHMEVFIEVTGRRDLFSSQRKQANIIRDQDFKWVEECDLFIGLFFGGSDGRGAEFEHLRLLMELKRGGQLIGRDVVCEKALCIFPDTKRSRIIAGISEEERSFIHQYFVKDEKESLDIIKLFLETRYK